MKTLKAFSLSLGDLNSPIVTRYQLGLIVYRIYKEKVYKGEKIALQRDFADRNDLNRCLKDLMDEGILSNPRSLPSGAYAILGSKDWVAEEVACTVDPFAYISHLSAMAFHGLTDRIPAKLFLSSPGDREWKIFAEQKMLKDLGDDYAEYRINELPALLPVKMKKIGKTEIHRLNSKHLGAYKNIRDRGIRVATIGRTFLDMLRDPDLCGGINHVLAVYKEYGEQYLRLITDEINQNGKKIEKVRAGYILEERVKINDPVVESWTEFAQRGGSRKLDPSAEYEPTFSEKWCLSINVVEK